MNVTEIVLPKDTKFSYHLILMAEVEMIKIFHVYKC